MNDNEDYQTKTFSFDVDMSIDCDQIQKKLKIGNFFLFNI